jgi:GT2 family glycosyltransferase
LGLKRICVVTPTTGAPELEDAIRSVINQTIPVDHLVVCDGNQFKGKVDFIINKLVEHPSVTTCYLPFNTGADGFYGHRIFAAIGHLLPHDYILFLDQDNWFDNNHVESLVEECEKYNFEWSYSLRKIYDKDKQFICEDNCESLGRWPIWVSQPETPSYLIDSSSYCFSRSFLIMTGHLWHWGWGGDRRFYSIVKDHIQHKNYGCTGKHTLNYRLGGNEGSVQGEFFLQGNQIMSKQYQDKFPWKQQIR